MRLLFVLLACIPALPGETGAEFFEKKIRPVFATQCYACHSSKMKSPMGGLVLDTKAGLKKGGGGGPAVTPGDPSKSRLLLALRFADPGLQMPPTGKLSDTVIGDFEEWIRQGAPDPRPEEVAVNAPAASGMTVEAGKQWWAFQPIRESAPPRIPQGRWPRTKSDHFVLNRLVAAGLQPSPEADPRTLIRRVVLNLTGLTPTFDEVEAFAAAPDYEALVDRLLASPRYGERWGRYWLDVARFAEDNPTSEATNPPYPYAWRYRDWVIQAVNRDVPYDRFVKLQLAADLMPGVERDDWRATGYLGAAPVYHKDARLSKEVIETLASDDWDERVDAVSRGLLGLTVACARCHDHKFDPIPTKDYYSLASVFASTSAVQRPLAAADPDKERQFLLIQQQLVHWDYLAKLLTGEPGTNPEKSKQTVARYTVKLNELKAQLAALGEPEWEKQLANYGPGTKRTRGDNSRAEAPFMNAVYEAGLWIDGSDPDLTVMDYRPATPRDLPIFLRGNVANHGDPAPRRFLAVLAKADRPFQQGSGRLEFAEKVFSDAAPLAARVIVNRVWGWHFGKPLTATTSDFGTQGEKPSHPELLDDLAARFVSNGWSLKWLNREIVLSAAYRQASRPRPDGEKLDPTNKWIWRMNPRRLDIEAWRDSMLRITGTLSESMYGPSEDLDAAGNQRRTVYARVSRGRLNALLRLYDFSDPSQHSPGRELTTTPLQQLFVMNSAFLQQQAAQLAKLAGDAPGDRERIESLYKRVLSRQPSPKELDLALSYLGNGNLPQLAQALLATNELIYWP